MTERGASPFLRPATPADIPTLRAITDEEEAPPDAAAGGFPEALDAYHRFLIDHGDVRLAEPAGEAAGFGAVIATGFGAVIATGRGVHLADLFVRRAHQGTGIGRALLEALFGDRWPRTTFSSDDPRALPLYVRFGMRPWWPNLYLAGDGRRLSAEPGVVVDEATWADVAALEREWWGLDRPHAHRYWAGQPHAASIVVRRGGTVVAAGHARARLRGTGRWISNFFVAPGAEPHDPTLAALRASSDPEGRIGTCVLGPHPIVPTLLAAGFRVVDRDTYQASDPDLIDPERWLVNTGFL